MSEKFTMKLVRRPDWARKPKPRIESEKAFRLFNPRIFAIVKILHAEIEKFVNDPDQCFLSEEDGFPLKTDLSGEFYLSDVIYESQLNRDREIQYELWISTHCLEKNKWHENQTNFDYLGLEAIFIIKEDSDEIDFDGFNTSVI